MDITYDPDVDNIVVDNPEDTAEECDDVDTYEYDYDDVYNYELDVYTIDNNQSEKPYKGQCEDYLYVVKHCIYNIKSNVLGDTTIEEYIIKNQAYVNSRDEHGYTALYYSVISGNSYILALLIKNGADLNYKYGPPNYEENIIRFAIYDYKRFDCFKLLVETKKIDLNIKDTQGDTILTRIIDCECMEYSQCKCSDVLNCKCLKYYDHVMLLLKHDVDIYAKNANSQTAMYLCMKNFITKYIVLFVKYGFDMRNINQHQLNNCLHTAINKYDLVLFYFALSHGAVMPRLPTPTYGEYISIFITSKCIADNNRFFIKNLFGCGIFYDPSYLINFEIGLYEALKNTEFYGTLIENGLCEDFFEIQDNVECFGKNPHTQFRSKNNN